MSRAREIADLGSPAASGLSNRNLIINGGMQISQRATSVTGLGTNTSGTYPTLDRFVVLANNTAGRLTMSQSTVTDLPGFANALKLDCTTADTSIAADEYFLFATRLEAQNLQSLKKGTSSAEPVTVSFYVKGNASATYVLEIFDNDNSRTISKTFSVTSSWNRVSITYPGDTAGSGLGDDNDIGLQLVFWLHAGSNSTSGSLQTSWGAYTQANRAVGISSIVDSTDRTLEITGLQMEIGDGPATTFEHESIGTTLAKCQRYYVKFEAQGAYTNYAFGSVTNGTTAEVHASLPVTMRDEPVIETSGTLGNFRTWDGGGGYTVTAINQGNYSNLNVGSINVGCSGGGMTTGRAVKLQDNGTHTANYIAFKAEL
jgi:hypothetical protein